MELVLSNLIFCDAIVPLPSNKLVCYGIFNEITSSKYPFAYPHFSVMTAWTNGIGFHIQVLKLLNPTRSLIISQSSEQYFTLQEQTETAYVTTNVNQIVFTEPGTYFFQVLLDNKLREEVPLHFKQE